MRTSSGGSASVRNQEVERRSGPRVALTYLIEITGFDYAGQIFSERTTTRNVSELGCQFKCFTCLEPGDFITVQRKDHSQRNDPPQLFRIAWVEFEKSGRLVGAQKNQKRRLWDLRFPPGNLPETPQ